MSPTWQYENLLGLDLEFRETARKLVQSRLPNYTDDHCVKLFGGSPYEFYSRCVLDESRNLVGVMAFSVGQLDTVEIVAFVSAVDGTGIGRFLMDSFVGEMKTKKKSSILTYIEPSAFPFFSRFSFIKQIPARSLYERITSKYVRSIFMYRDLLEPIPVGDRRPVAVGDRLLVMVDGTMVPRQAQVKEIDTATGRMLVHYYFWNARHDEWIYPHSPRIRWDLPLPDEPPKKQGENKTTSSQVKELFAVEMKNEKKLELFTNNGSWPRGVKKGGAIQVRLEGNWLDAKIVEKGEMYLYCQFEYHGTTWLQDFPRDALRLAEGQTSVIDALLQRKGVPVPKRKRAASEEPVKPRKYTKRVVKNPIELTPPLKSSRRRTSVSEPVTECAIPQSPGESNRALRKRLREETDSPDLHGKSDTDTHATPSDLVLGVECSICLSEAHEKRMLVCMGCGLGAHSECNVVNVSLGKNGWVCDLCREIRIGNHKINPRCVCCSQKGRYVMSPTLDFKWVHVRCARLFRLDFHPNTGQYSAIRSVHSPSKAAPEGSPICLACKSATGSLLVCMNSECDRVTHVACGSDWKLDIGTGEAVVLCPEHGHMHGNLIDPL